MREKLILSDQNFLFVCTLNEWNTVARKCLTDAVLMRDGSAQVTVICGTDTRLEHELRRNGLHVLCVPDSSIKWRRQMDLIQLLNDYLKSNIVNLIHCYNYEALLPVTKW